MAQQVAQQMVQPIPQHNPIWGRPLDLPVHDAKTMIWDIDLRHVPMFPDQIVAAKMLCYDRDLYQWFRVVLTRDGNDARTCRLYVELPYFAPVAGQDYLCNVSSWIEQNVVTGTQIQNNHITRIVLEIMVMGGAQVPGLASPAYAIRF
ncbi:hypothetical protein K457DRAFT_24701 [Linnemannia elongata AG-77]|uniref:Uncharacterized protein n=1 Tax=Linnemannia elongata AG-77 TaxID=1314771 RepID=A0A197JHD7_9FUNG|nr:hypothetical protein K457DRAFT_24701 [Linnemannia elongata AG-77]